MSNAIVEIPELGHYNSEGGNIRIPHLQDIPFTNRVRSIVDTAEFQRLRHITQLGLAALVYPGATHTRFEHALGVYHNATKYLLQLSKDPRFCEIIDVHHAELLIVSALLHDLGHWPFCHPIEDIELELLPPHEEFAKEFLSPNRELAKVLKSEWNIDPEEVLDVLVKKTDSSPLNLLRSILSGPIDIDKMDYLERDSLYAGVPYGRHFDRNRLIQSLILNEAGDGLAISYKGKSAAELMVFSRYTMFSEVYWHHTVRSATSMFARAFYEMHTHLDLQSFFQKSEAETILELRTKANGTDCEQLVEGIFGIKRSIYKCIVEYSIFQQPDLYHQLSGQPYHVLTECTKLLISRLNALMNTNYSSTDIVIDAPPPHREVEFQVDVYFENENKYRPFHQVSPVVEALARHQFDDYVKRVRIFAHPRISSELCSHEKITEIIVNIVKEMKIPESS